MPATRLKAATLLVAALCLTTPAAAEPAAVPAEAAKPEAAKPELANPEAPKPPAAKVKTPRPPLVISAARGPAAPPVPPPRKLRKNEKPMVPCRLFVGDIQDLRQDKGTMGYMAEMVYASDAPGWVRSGFVTLRADARYTLVDTAEAADVVLSVDVLKSYIFSVNMTKAATVVFRVRYAHAGAPTGEGIYRGTRDALNWAGTKGETVTALNDALVEAVGETKTDLAKACAAARP